MLNSEQLKAVESRNCNLLISASAGSGKTKVLITRIANMLKNKETDISKLLIVTFTKASAIEMKERLINELSEIRKISNDEQLRAFLLSQIEEIPLSDISTIHSFCAKIVRKYFYELNLDPAFKLIEETLIDLKLEAINNVINQYISVKDNEFENLYYILNQKRNNKLFIETVFNISEILHKTNNNLKEKAKNCFQNNLNKNTAIKYINSYIEITCKQVLSKIKEYVSNQVISEEKFTTYLSFCINYLNQIILEKEFCKRIEIISNTTFPKNYLKENKLEYAFILNLIKKEIKNNVKKIIKDLTTESEIISNINQSSWLSKKLIEVTEKYNSEFYLLKQKNALLDLNDVEELTIKLLENERVRAEIQQSYDYIFIDEYQDTNEIQENILTKISKSNNMFMVGDAKQSIYGFRLCDPSIFCGKYDSFQDYGINQKIDLNKNYRSNKNILDFTNKVCSKCITKQIGNIDYLNDAMLETEIEISSIKSIPSVQVFAIPKIKVEKNDINILTNKIYSVKEDQCNTDLDATLIHQEAQIIASQIKSIVDSELEVVIDNKPQIKKIQYKDICILSRTKKGYLQKLASILKKYEIPVRVTYKDDILSYFEVKILIDLLKTISNYYDDISIVSTFNNIFNFSFEELAEIRKSAPEDYFYKSVLKYKEINKNELQEKIEMSLTQLHNLKVESGYLTIFELLNEIIEKYNYFTKLMCLDNSKEKIENVKVFINSVKSSTKTINEFLQEISSVFGKNSKDLSIDNGENSVQLESIHSSKGLEYPVVILTNCGKDFTRARNDNFIKFNKNVGISCASFDVEYREKKFNIIEEVIKFANKQDEFEGNLRLLYVALTRAKNNLLIVGELDFEKLTPITSDLDVMNAKTYMQLILGSLNINYEKLESEKYVQLDNSVELNVIYPISTIYNAKYKQDFEQISLSETDKNIISSIFNYNYPYIQSTNLAVKSSVSSLNKTDDIEVSYNYTPKNLTLNEHNSELTADKVGTAYHSVMQNISYNVITKEDVVKAISNMVASNILSVEESREVCPEKILNCVNIIKSLINENSKVLKEQPFIMRQKYNEIIKNSDITDEILIQGIIDLVIINNDTIYIIDFKTNKTTEQNLIKLYKKQLQLYADSARYSLNQLNIRSAIYSFFLEKLIYLN